MSEVKLNIKSLGDGVFSLQINLSAPIQPSDLPQIKFPKAQGQGLIISGRAPIWLYCYVLHHYLHLFQYVAIYDPKLQGAVVIASHHPSYKIGEVIRGEF